MVTRVAIAVHADASLVSLYSEPFEKLPWPSSVFTLVLLACELSAGRRYDSLAK
jgi:hypothetical protein